MSPYQITNKFVDSRRLHLGRRESPVIWSNFPMSDPVWPDYVANGYYQGRLDSLTVDSQWIQSRLRDVLDSERPGRILERGMQILRSQFDIHHQFPEFLQKMITPQLLQQARTILGGEPILYQSHINFKSAHVGGSYDWHSDYTYWREQDGMLVPRAISIMFPLEVHGPENGGLQLLKGSHHYYYPNQLTASQPWQLENILHDVEEKHRPSGLINDTYLRLFDQSCFVSPELKLGDYLVMDANTWHFSAANHSAVSRSTLFVILTTSETGFDLDKINHRPQYITCRKGVSLRSFITT